MKTTKSLSQLVSEFRTQKNYVGGKAFQFFAKAIKTEIERQETISRARMQARTTVPVRAWITQRISAKLTIAAKNFRDDELSMGSLYIARVGTIEGRSDRREDYNRSCKYAAKHYKHVVTFKHSDICRLQVIGGLTTIVHEEVIRGIRRCEYITSNGRAKANFELQRKEGFITAGFHATSLQEAVTFRKEKAISLLAFRKEERRKQDFEQKIQHAMHMFYGYQHAVDAGCCVPGIENFLGASKLEKEMGYRGDFIMKVAKAHNVEYYAMNIIRNRALHIG